MMLPDCNSPLLYRNMSGREKGRKRERVGEWVGEAEDGREESDEMKPPDVKPLEAAASRDIQGYNPQSPDCNL